MSGTKLQFRLSAAAQQLVVRHEPLAKAEVAKWLRTYAVAREHVDDLLQEARLALVYATRAYRPGRSKLTFGGYARFWVRARIIWALKRTAPVTCSSRTHTLTQALGRRSFTPFRPAETDSESLPETPPAELEALAAEMHQVLLREWPRVGGQHKTRSAHYAERAADWFVRYHFAGDVTLAELGREAGLSRERVRQVLRHSRDIFERWAHEVREEAA